MSETTELALIKRDISYIKRELREINNKLEKAYITKKEFDPVKSIVYGMIGLILLTVGGAIVSLVIM